MREIIFKNALIKKDFIGANAVYYTEDYLIIFRKEIDFENRIISRFYLFEVNEKNWEIFRNCFFA